MVDLIKSKRSDNTSKPHAPERRGTLKFEVDASLLYQLGEQLVARRSIALAELIKNSYDADATFVTVLLENVTKPEGTIIIQDNGMGMTYEEIRDNWMRVGTTDKVEHPLSPYCGRVRTGAKGVGRFAVRKLGEKLTLLSVAKRDDGKKEEVTVEFDWTGSFEAGNLLNEIPVTYKRKVVADDTSTGVILYIAPARDIWTEKDISDLRQDLLSLVNPLAAIESKGKASRRTSKRDVDFRFTLESPEFPEYEGELGERFLGAAWGVLTGSVDNKGVAHYDFRVAATADRLNYTLADERFHSLHEVRFVIYYFVYKKELFEDFEFGISYAQRMGRERGGVRIYLDGFRVFPYGDPGDDWLKLNEIRARRTPQLLHPPDELREMGKNSLDRPELLTPGSNQLFGTVEISRSKQTNIEINVSRERFIENEAFDELRRFVLLGIYWMTIQYARLTYAEREARRKERKTAVSASKVIEEAQELLKDLKNYSNERQSATIRSLEQKLYFAIEQSDRERQERISELSLLRVLASVGTTVAIMNHQLREVVDGVRTIYTDLKELEQSIKPAAKSGFNRLLEQAQEWRDQVDRQVGLLDVLLSADARQRRKRIVLRNFIERIEGAFLLYMRDYRITFSNEVQSNIRTRPMFQAELGAVFFNIMSNSLKAVRTTKEKKVSINAKREGDDLIIQVLDTGVGVEPERSEVVFEAFETTSEPDLILGAGTGIGLKVVRDIVETYNGTARFTDPPAPWITCLEIRLPE